MSSVMLATSANGRLGWRDCFKNVHCRRAVSVAM